MAPVGLPHWRRHARRAQLASLRCAALVVGLLSLGCVSAFGLLLL